MRGENARGNKSLKTFPFLSRYLAVETMRVSPTCYRYLMQSGPRYFKKEHYESPGVKVVL